MIDPSEMMLAGGGHEKENKISHVQKNRQVYATSFLFDPTGHHHLGRFDNYYYEY